MELGGESESAPQLQTRANIEEAFKKFEAAIYSNDARLFRRVTLNNVWDAARAIESDQSSRRSLRNTRRIQPLFEALKIFGSAIEPLCQGVPCLCYIWVSNHSPTRHRDVDSLLVIGTYQVDVSGVYHSEDISHGNTHTESPDLRQLHGRL